MDDTGVEKVIARRKVTREQAFGIICKWWNSRLVAHDLSRQAVIAKFQPKYIPFWYIRANITGRVVGYEYATESNIDLDVNFSLTYRWTDIACDSQGIGFEYLKDPFIETEPFDPKTVDALNPMIPREEAITRSSTSIEIEAIKYADVQHINEKYILFKPCEVMLVFYPIWSVKYSYSGQAYWATIDGLNGQIIAGRAPGNIRLRRRALIGGILIAILGAALNIWIMFNNSSHIAPILWLAIAATCMVVVWGTFAFFYSEPVVVIDEHKGILWHFGVSVGPGAVRKDYSKRDYYTRIVS